MIVSEKDVMVPMADGVRLATDAFRLQDGPPSPALLVRTPYGKDRMTIGGAESFDILRAVQAGYVVSPRTSAAATDPKAGSSRTSTSPVTAWT